MDSVRMNLHTFIHSGYLLPCSENITYQGNFKQDTFLVFQNTLSSDRKCVPVLAKQSQWIFSEWHCQKSIFFNIPFNKLIFISLNLNCFNFLFICHIIIYNVCIYKIIAREAINTSFLMLLIAFCTWMVWNQTIA